MNNKQFFTSLNNFKMVNSIWEYILNIIRKQISNQKNQDQILNLITLYFSLIDDGNICMSLDKKTLHQKYISKAFANQILLEEDVNFNKNEYNQIIDYISKLINENLSILNEENLSSIIGINKFFMIDDNYLYLSKYYFARINLIKSINRLFTTKRTQKSTFSYQTIIKNNFQLSLGQEEAILQGVSKNLVITGGPGTGKTTSILFLLLNILTNNPNMIVYLTAPSGKASSRMKESILGGLNLLNDEYLKNNHELIEKINNLEESTIHRLLGQSKDNNGFLYNKNHQFPSNSVFIIDEASMIDISLFNFLLEAIPNDAFVYIMGDKNQLPSVECGAVFGELLKMPLLKDNVVQLDESIRFTKDTKIFELAYAINNGLTLPVKENDWKDFQTFEIYSENNLKPVYYYNINHPNYKTTQIIENIITKWGNAFYKNLQKNASNIKSDDASILDHLFKDVEYSKILCAENKSPRGVEYINNLVKKLFIDPTKSISLNGYYPGMIVMINKNNKNLDLYNGDTGVLVTFENDNTLYLMINKESKIINEEGKKTDKIFKLFKKTFYPFRLITKDEINLAYAITIHKSQGSDYKNILIILPEKKGHPLLNRQIIYTAITRTKGNTYLLSNQNCLQNATNYLIERDTNIS